MVKATHEFLRLPTYFLAVPVPPKDDGLTSRFANLLPARLPVPFPSLGTQTKIFSCIYYMCASETRTKSRLNAPVPIARAHENFGEGWGGIRGNTYED